MSNVYLVDIDGTISDDIKNEESHLYGSAGVLPHSKEVLNKLPMEFAVEAQKLLEISLEGSVG